MQLVKLLKPQLCSLFQPKHSFILRLIILPFLRQVSSQTSSDACPGTTPTPTNPPTTTPRIAVITTPLFYVNSKPHIGHFYSAVLGDTLARWHQMLGDSEPPSPQSTDNPLEPSTAPAHSTTQPSTAPAHSTSTSNTQPIRRSFLVVGTDEHGSKVLASAQQAGAQVALHCSLMHSHFLHMYNLAQVDFGACVRTTHPQHAHTVHTAWRRLVQGGYIYKGEYKVVISIFLYSIFCDFSFLNK